MTSQSPGFKAVTIRSSASSCAGTWMSTRRAWIRSKVCVGSGSVPMSWRWISMGAWASEALSMRKRGSISVTSTWPACPQRSASHAAIAPADLRALPPRTDAGGLQVADGPGIVERLQAGKTLTGRLSGILKEVGAHS
jgi:hypothetical protein